jgi:DNA-binding MarR family transcriptional regulator
MEADLPCLMALRVQGVAAPGRLAAATGTDPSAAATRAEALVGGGLASKRTGRVSGYVLTPEGHEVLRRTLAEEGLRANAQLREAYEAFMVCNASLLQVASDWQVRRHGPIEAPNDHADADYDQDVIDRLRALHDRACVVLRRMSQAGARFESYRRRLEACLERLESGDTAAFTAPLAESYHTVWFELHQDLLLTLGLEREA